MGFGSFYNHFSAKQDLFDAAMDEVLEEHGAMLDDLTSDIEDPAEVFAVSVRITARFPRTHPELAQILARSGPRYLTARRGWRHGRCATSSAPETRAGSASTTPPWPSPARVARCSRSSTWPWNGACRHPRWIRRPTAWR